jgi:hypothetical protein
MEVAREFKKSPPARYNELWIDKRFALSAAVLILAAAIFGGMMGSGRNLRSFTSPNAKSSYRVVDEIEKDYASTASASPSSSIATAFISSR